MKEKEVDGLKITVQKSGDGKEYRGIYLSETIEEDTWYPARLKEIEQGEQTYKQKTSPAWIWVYELLGSQFTGENSDGEKEQKIVVERTSKKFTSAPRKSKAYIRYSQLNGAEPEVGEEVDLRELFGKTCKLMLKQKESDKTNDAGDPIIYTNVEKVSVKGTKKSDKPPKVKKTSTKVKEESIESNLGEVPKDDEDIMDIFD